MLRTPEQLIELAAAHNAALAATAHLGYKSHGFGAVLLPPTLSAGNPSEVPHVTYQALLPDQLAGMAYDPLTQYLVMDTKNGQYVLVRYDAPAQSPYEMYRRRDPALDRHLHGEADLTLLLKTHDDWLSAFANRARTAHGPGVLMLTSAATPEQLEAQEKLQEVESLSTRVNNHVALIYMPVDSFAEYMAANGENPGNTLRILSLANNQSGQYVAGLDDGEQTQYASQPLSVPQRPAPPLGIDDILKKNVQRLFLFGASNHAVHNRGLVHVGPASKSSLPSMTLDDAGVWQAVYWPLADYETSSLKTAGGLAASRQILSYPPQSAVLVLLQTEDGFSLRTYQPRQRTAAITNLFNAAELQPAGNNAFDRAKARIEQGSERLSGAAYRGNKLMRRGAMLVLPNQQTRLLKGSLSVRELLTVDNEHKALFIPMTQLRAMVQGDSALWSAISLYDTAREFVILYVSPAGAITSEHIRAHLNPRRDYQKHQDEIDRLYMA